MNKLSFLLFAASAASLSAAAEQPIEELIIVGSSLPIERQKLASALTVLDGEAIDAIGAPHAADLLRHIPGLAVSRTGAWGGITNVRIRGAEANHVLVFIDGVEANDANGDIDLSALVSDNIERIEVLRGPQSGLYGSNATAGVINIITRNAGRGFGLNAQVEAGSLDFQSQSVRLHGGSETVSGSLSLHHQESAFDASVHSNEYEDDDRSENFTYLGKGKVAVSDALTLDGHFRYVNKTSDIDGSGAWGTPEQGIAVDSAGHAELRERLYGLSATLDLLDGNLTTRLAYDYTDRADEGFSRGLLRDSGSDTSRKKINWMTRYALSGSANYEHSAAVFAEREVETFKHKEVFDVSQLEEQRRRLTGYGLEYRAEVYNRVYLALSARHDNNDDFEDETTYSLGASAWLTDSTRLHATVGRGVTNPSFYEQFGYIPATYRGNPSLEPEVAQSWDVGIEQQFGDGDMQVDLTYFHSDLEQEIATDYSVFPYTPFNLQEDSERRGVELSFSAALLDSLSLAASYTHTDAEERGETEVRRAKNMGSVDLRYRFLGEAAALSLGAVYNGSQLDNDFRPLTPPQIRLDSYVLVNLGASYRLSPELELFGHVHNALDEQYQEVFSYGTAGRHATVGMRFAF